MKNILCLTILFALGALGHAAPATTKSKLPAGYAFLQWGIAESTAITRTAEAWPGATFGDCHSDDQLLTCMSVQRDDKDVCYMYFYRSKLMKVELNLPSLADEDAELKMRESDAIWLKSLNDAYKTTKKRLTTLHGAPPTDFAGDGSGILSWEGKETIAVLWWDNVNFGAGPVRVLSSRVRFASKKVTNLKVKENVAAADKEEKERLQKSRERTNEALRDLD